METALFCSKRNRKIGSNKTKSVKWWRFNVTEVELKFALSTNHYLSKNSLRVLCAYTCKSKLAVMPAIYCIRGKLRTGTTLPHIAF